MVILHISPFLIVNNAISDYNRTQNITINKVEESHEGLAN
jgi:hypothetical protein